MTPGVSSVCSGTIRHRRTEPARHEFDYPMSMVWIDPDHPNDLCRHHRLYSSSHPAPVRFDRADYGDERTAPLGLLVRDDLEKPLGRRPDGPIRMLTQIRHFGWLFNPITIFLAWDGDDPDPVGAVLEVTNTPWHERHRYAVALDSPGPDGEGPRLIDRPSGHGKRTMRTARFSKELHVSPFFGEDFDYLLGVESFDPDPVGDEEDGDIRIDLQLIAHDDDRLALDTSLELERTPATRRSLGRSLRSAPLSTYRVSGGIHRQAARLLSKRVPFVAHPKRSSAPSDEAASGLDPKHSGEHAKESCS